MTDPTLLSWINTEVERALAFVQESLARFSAAPQNEAVLQPCPEHLHQVSGALRMVGLSGATRVCEAIEGSFASLRGAADTGSHGVIDRAVVALKNFVGELARGHADVPLRLFPVYRDLAALLAKALSPRRTFSTPMSAFRRRGTERNRGTGRRAWPVSAGAARAFPARLARLAARCAGGPCRDARRARRAPPARHTAA